MVSGALPVGLVEMRLLVCIVRCPVMRHWIIIWMCCMKIVISRSR